jgi:NAD(P)-dependent dehydrogenase (short-subunit alcohol dehydrogenase family)
MFSLSGKKILITGASRGLGSVCARAFAESGATLALMARSADDLESVRNSCVHAADHRAVPVDLTDSKSLQEKTREVMDFLGQIDAVLHVAGGGLGLREPLISSGDLRKLMALNVMAAVEINRLAAPSMIERGQGNLVHVGSIAGAEAVASVGYNTAKATLAAYVRSLGNALAKPGVVVTGILPGGFNAPGNSWERLQASKPDVVERFVGQRLPRGRLADAEELVPLLAFLCSDAASMMGGCMVPIDAGEGITYATA